MVRSCYIHPTADPQLQEMNKHNSGAIGKVVEPAPTLQGSRSYRGTKPGSTPQPSVDVDMDIDAISVSTDEIPQTPSPPPKSIRTRHSRHPTTPTSSHTDNLGYKTPPVTLPARRFIPSATLPTGLATPPRSFRGTGPPVRDPKQPVRRPSSKKGKTVKAAAAPSTRQLEIQSHRRVNSHHVK